MDSVKKPSDARPKRKHIPTCFVEREIGGVRKATGPSKCLELKAEENLINREYEEFECKFPEVARSTFLMVFSADRKLIASTHGNRNVYISDLTTGKHIKTLTGHPRTPWCIAFHPNSNQILASGCLGGQVRVWDLQGESEIWTAESQTVIASLTFHPTDHVLVIASYNEVHFWDWSRKAPFAKCSTSNEREKVRYVSFDRYGHKLITGIANAPELTSQWDKIGTLTNQCSHSDHEGMVAVYCRYMEEYEQLEERYVRLMNAGVPRRIRFNNVTRQTVDRGTDPMIVTRFIPSRNWCPLCQKTVNPSPTTATESTSANLPGPSCSTTASSSNFNMVEPNVQCSDSGGTSHSNIERSDRDSSLTRKQTVDRGTDPIVNSGTRWCPLCQKTPASLDSTRTTTATTSTNTPPVPSFSRSISTTTRQMMDRGTDPMVTSNSRSRGWCPLCQETNVMASSNITETSHLSSLPSCSRLSNSSSNLVQRNVRFLNIRRPSSTHGGSSETRESMDRGTDPVVTSGRRSCPFCQKTPVASNFSTAETTSIHSSVSSSSSKLTSSSSSDPISCSTPAPSCSKIFTSVSTRSSDSTLINSFPSCSNFTIPTNSNSVTSSTPSTHLSTTGSSPTSASTSNSASLSETPTSLATRKVDVRRTFAGTNEISASNSSSQSLNSPYRIPSIELRPSNVPGLSPYMLKQITIRNSIEQAILFAYHNNKAHMSQSLVDSDTPSNRDSNSGPSSSGNASNSSTSPNLNRTRESFLVDENRTSSFTPVTRSSSTQLPFNLSGVYNGIQLVNQHIENIASSFYIEGYQIVRLRALWANLDGNIRNLLREVREMRNESVGINNNAEMRGGRPMTNNSASTTNTSSSSDTSALNTSTSTDSQRSKSTTVENNQVPRSLVSDPSQSESSNSSSRIIRIRISPVTPPRTSSEARTSTTTTNKNSSSSMSGRNGIPRKRPYPFTRSSSRSFSKRPASEESQRTLRSSLRGGSSRNVPMETDDNNSEDINNDQHQNSSAPDENGDTTDQPSSSQSPTSSSLESTGTHSQSTFTLFQSEHTCPRSAANALRSSLIRIDSARHLMNALRESPRQNLSSWYLDAISKKVRHVIPLMVGGLTQFFENDQGPSSSDDRMETLNQRISSLIELLGIAINLCRVLLAHLDRARRQHLRLAEIQDFQGLLRGGSPSGGAVQGGSDNQEGAESNGGNSGNGENIISIRGNCGSNVNDTGRTAPPLITLNGLPITDIPSVNSPPRNPPNRVNAEDINLNDRNNESVRMSQTCTRGNNNYEILSDPLSRSNPFLSRMTGFDRRQSNLPSNERENDTGRRTAPPFITVNGFSITDIPSVNSHPRNPLNRVNAEDININDRNNESVRLSQIRTQGTNISEIPPYPLSRSNPFIFRTTGFDRRHSNLSSNERDNLLRIAPPPVLRVNDQPVVLDDSSDSNLPATNSLFAPRAVRPLIVSSRNSPFFIRDGDRTYSVSPSAHHLRPRYNHPRHYNVVEIVDNEIMISLSAPLHRIQAWDFTNFALPEIHNSDKNLVVGECKIHNDASVDISNDGKILVTLLSAQRFNVSTMLGIYSLNWNTLGQCLYKTSFDQSAVSVSLSPTTKHLIVGLASRRINFLHCEKQTIAQIYKLEKIESDSSSKEEPSGRTKGILTLVKDLEISREITDYFNLNCIRWAPTAGEGFVYATNAGKLRILR
ncbi:uncharacterized protein LOC106665611 isoform X2 [Cimex lectularius]|uniref:Activating molecule in BECN1-regulated autophagy protein 1 n=1 Tax=Cimex lectularius TaxID=79782 RepID=A0A8I6STH3_CIMLE|nr:uncharacterized protein LOC106665611 isoform X2 [Cimex lectularius]